MKGLIVIREKKTFWVNFKFTVTSTEIHGKYVQCTFRFSRPCKLIRPNFKKNWRLPAKSIDGFQYKKNLRMLLWSLVLLGTVLIIFWLFWDDCSHCGRYNCQENWAGNYMFKVNNRNTKARWEICSKLTIKTP